MRVQYYKGDTPVNVDWKPDVKGDLTLYIDNKETDIIIKLSHTSIGKTMIFTNYKGRLYSGVKYKLGPFKKRILADIFNIKFKYVED